LKTTSTEPTNSRERQRYDLNTLLPVVNRRVLRGDFVTQADMAANYGVEKSTATHWKRRALKLGLATEREWLAGFLRGQLNRLATA
jgi:hypothetical protein